jgi:hypothetical protein
MTSLVSQVVSMGLMSPSSEDDSGLGSLDIPRLGDNPITRLWSTIFRVSMVACSNGDWWSIAERWVPGWWLGAICSGM